MLAFNLLMQIQDHQRKCSLIIVIVVVIDNKIRNTEMKIPTILKINVNFTTKCMLDLL